MAKSISSLDAIALDAELDPTIIDQMAAAIELRENTWRHHWAFAIKQGKTPAQAAQYANQMTH